MAKNKPVGDSVRKGAVKNRDQVYNPRIDRWIKRNDKGMFMDQKADGEKFKGVRKNK